MTRVRLRVRALLAALTALLVVLTGMTLLPAEPAQAAPVSISCEPGTVYSVSGKGALREMRNGASPKILVGDSGFSSFNGLGVTKDANGRARIYGYERVNNAYQANIYSLDTATGNWTSTGRNTGGTKYQFVGGAVDPNTGRFYLGGFTPDGKRFGIFVFDPVTNSISQKGEVNTNEEIVSGKLANGDMAFDGAGTLFIVRGMDDETSIFSISKADLDRGNGTNLVPRSFSGPYTTAVDVNGVAFDSEGRGYLGASEVVSQWATPDWDVENDTWFDGKRGFGSSDLATCSTPPSITLLKNVVNGRAKDGDQFTLSLKSGATQHTPVTTSGSSTGIQTERVGALPTGRGVRFDFSESGAGRTDLADYEKSYVCTVDGVQIPGAKGETASGSVTIPNQGKEIVCTITNAPLTANVSIHKDVVDENGENKKPGKDWSVSAKATATTDTVTSTPTAATQKTDTNGDAKWGLKFGKTTGRATIAVSETQQDGYEFKSGSCTITGLDGKSTEKKLTSDKSFDLTGIKPGDDVKCSYLNKVKDTSLTLIKKVDNEAAAGTAKDTDWTLKAVGDKDSGNKTIEGKTGSEAVTNAKVKAGKYSLSESEGPKGYEASDWVCEPSTGSAKVTSDKSSVTLKAGDEVTCTITNTAKTGAVTWSKTDESGNALKGSVWTLTHPDGKSTEIEDCVAASADKCSGSDKDPAAGKLSVDKLEWGDYTLVEKKAPAGYILDDTEHTFTISGDKLSKEFAEPFENEQKPPVALPLTGGTGSQIYLIGGAALLAAAGAIALLKGLRRRNRKH